MVIFILEKSLDALIAFDDLSGKIFHSYSVSLLLVQHLIRAFLEVVQLDVELYEVFLNLDRFACVVFTVLLLRIPNAEYLAGHGDE